MKRRFSHNRRAPHPPGIPFAMTAFAALAIACPAISQEQTSPPVPVVTPAPQTKTQDSPPPPLPGSAQTAPPSGGAQPPAVPAPPAPGAITPGIGTPSQPILRFKSDDGVTFSPSGEIDTSGNVEVRYADVTVTADRLTGNLNSELIFSGHAKIVSAGETSYADAIHVFTGRRSYRLDNPRSILSPEFLQNRLMDPVYLNGGLLAGTTGGYSLADNFTATTCREPFHHYEFRVAEAELYPHKKLILRRVGVYFFGVKLITLPTLVIPLDIKIRQPRRPRTDYLPEFGQNAIEGYYARFPYTFAVGSAAATFLRLDVTQKRGEGYRFEQEYLAGKQDSGFNTSFNAPTGGGFTGATSGTIANSYGYGTTGRLPLLGTGLGPQNGGLFAIQGYFADGIDRDFSGSFRHQQGIGGNNRIAFSTELQRNSSFTIGSVQTNQNTRFNFNHNDSVHGVTADFTLGLATNDSGAAGFSSKQLTGGYRQSFDFASSGANRNALSYSFDLSRFSSSSSGQESRMARLESQFQLQHSSREYSYTLQANHSTAIGHQTQSGSFGALEKLPELTFTSDTINYKGGWLHRLPLHFDADIGRFDEPGHNFQNNRILFGVQMNEISVLRGRTEINTGGGIEQRLYSDGAAQYQVRNFTRLRQHLGGRSGFDINYTYAQPEGGTPFQFDTYTRAHSITAEGGYLDDKRFQLTARVGYDLLGTSRQNPFQSLTTRLMWRPTPSFRFDMLSTYDPNTGKFFAFTNSFRIRAANDFGIDLVSRYDPQQKKFSQINGQFDIPLGRTWRAAALLRYNGFSNRFESTNLQVTHDWDCLQASLTYSDNPLSFGNNRQFFFSIRIKALPTSRSYARGPAGQTIGLGLGDFN